MTRLALLALLALSVFPGMGAQAQTLTEVRTQLQAALQRSLSRSMMEGALPHLDLTTGQLTKFYPTENHEIILKMDEVYVMCATLLGPDGKEVPVDYYISQSGGRYGVIRTEINNRTPLKALMDAGRATRLE
ncbi:MAG: hypothetical protein KBT70_00165 [Roseovarius sp.]|jgi:hypothetical protein|uniref:hypothetical protein n=1 Tax=Roseovarius sp. TaxID=1486281 RepID=UPI001B728D0C|nr:hypothetical protein [Roseovarius sp.]MBQ0748584.1 hypothetical protein [Roseovarius sp.]MBQ0810990.1 hypothetical protein [Roseovarius sp.]